MEILLWAKAIQRVVTIRPIRIIDKINPNRIILLARAFQIPLRVKSCGSWRGRNGLSLGRTQMIYKIKLVNSSTPWRLSQISLNPKEMNLPVKNIAIIPVPHLVMVPLIGQVKIYLYLDQHWSPIHLHAQVQLIEVVRTAENLLSTSLLKEFNREDRSPDRLQDERPQDSKGVQHQHSRPFERGEILEATIFNCDKWSNSRHRSTSIA